MATNRSQDTVVRWLLADPNRGPADAAGHFWPELAGDDRARRCRTIRNWKLRALRRAGVAPRAALGALVAPRPPDAPSGPVAPATATDAELSPDQPRPVFLAAQRAALVDDLARVREAVALTLVGPLDARLVAANEALALLELGDGPMTLTRVEALAKIGELRKDAAWTQKVAVGELQWREEAANPGAREARFRALPAYKARPKGPQIRARGEVATLAADLAVARAAGMVRAVPALDKRLSAARDRLDLAAPDSGVLDALARASPCMLVAQIERAWLAEQQLQSALDRATPEQRGTFNALRGELDRRRALSPDHREEHA